MFWYHTLVVSSLCSSVELVSSFMLKTFYLFISFFIYLFFFNVLLSLSVLEVVALVVSQVPWLCAPCVC
jgi:hypothetical protein